MAASEPAVPRPGQHSAPPASVDLIGDEELIRAGYVMAIGLLPLHRRFAAAGVLFVVHTEWPVKECYAFREGVLRAAGDRARAGDPCSALDTWILRNMVLHVALGLEHVVERLVPMQLPMLGRRARRLAPLVAATPAPYRDLAAAASRALVRGSITDAFPVQRVLELADDGLEGVGRGDQADDGVLVADDQRELLRLLLEPVDQRRDRQRTGHS